MAKNAYLQRIAQEREAAFSLAANWFRQMVWDAIQIELHQKYGWGADRLNRLNDGASEWMAFIMAGFEKRQDADYHRAKVDEALREIYGDKAVPWAERYEGWEENSVMKERKWR